jgi:hypothetical protein
MTWSRARVAAVVGGVVALGAAYAFGRWSSPTRVEEREVEKKVSVTLYASHEEWAKREKRATRTHVEETKKPDGEVVIITDTVDLWESDLALKSDKVSLEAQASERAKERVEERQAAKVAIFGTVGMGFNSTGMQPVSYGLAVTANVVGPLSVLVAGSGNVQGGQATVGVGLAF